MKKVKRKEAVGREKREVRIGHYSRYKKTPMVFIEGNFYNGGFYLSRAKLQAVSEFLGPLGRFRSGELDARIMKLKDDEVLKP